MSFGIAVLDISRKLKTSGLEEVSNYLSERGYYDVGEDKDDTSISALFHSALQKSFKHLGANYSLIAAEAASDFKEYKPYEDRLESFRDYIDRLATAGRQARATGRHINDFLK